MNLNIETLIDDITSRTPEYFSDARKALIEFFTEEIGKDDSKIRPYIPALIDACLVAEMATNCQYPQWRK